MTSVDVWISEYNSLMRCDSIDCMKDSLLNYSSVCESRDMANELNQDETKYSAIETEAANVKCDTSVGETAASDVECEDTSTFVLGILRDMCDKISGVNKDILTTSMESCRNTINLLNNYDDEQEQKNIYRKTFVFDDSTASDDDLCGEDERGGLWLSGRNISHIVNDDYDENYNKRISGDLNGLKANKYEVKAISKSAETISTSQNITDDRISEEDDNPFNFESNVTHERLVDAVNHLVKSHSDTMELSKSTDTISTKNKTPKHEKKLSFSSFFRKKDKSKESKPKQKSKTKIEHEAYDDFDPLENLSSTPPKSLLKGRRYSSALDISEKSASLPRTPSFVKRKLASLQSETKTLFRSMSFRDISKKKEKEKLADMKTVQWKSSLQRLVENDTFVSYTDFSFVNYDQLNTVTYASTSKTDTNIHRTQSMVEKVSCFFCWFYFIAQFL